jgi:transposase
MDRKGIRPAEHLGDYSGFMHADAYAGFEELYRSGKITAFGGQSPSDCLSASPCMAHIRREFFDEAQSNGTSTAIEVLTRIAQLYAVEAEARSKPPDERAAIRQAKARPVFEDLARWLQSALLKISGKSDLAKAVRYAVGRLPHFEVYLSNGHLEIDNNAAERGMRVMAIGRRNWMFAGSEGGGENAAIAYTLIETAKLNDTAPQAWLTDVLSRIADHPINRVAELAPWNFRK